MLNNAILLSYNACFYHVDAAHPIMAHLPLAIVHIFVSYVKFIWLDMYIC